MTNKVRVFVRTLCLVGLVSVLAPACQESQNLRGGEPQSEVEGISLSLYAEAQELSEGTVTQLDSEGRALSFSMDSQSGKTYPKPTISIADGTQVPVVVVLKKQGQNAIINQVNWTWSAPKQEQGRLIPGKLDAKGVNLNVGTHLTNNESGWKMFCVIGGTWDNQNKRIGFAATTDGPKQVNQSASLNAIYMSKDWVDVKVNQKPGTGMILEAAPTSFVNKTITLLYRATNKRGRNVFFRGFSIESEKLSFSGTFDLKNLEVGNKPSYTKGAGYQNRFFNAISGVSNGVTSYSVANDAKTDFFLTCAVPLQETLNPMKLRVAAIIGQNHGEDGRIYPFDAINNGGKGIKAGDFVSLHTIEIKQATLGHPIEQFLHDADSEETVWTPNDDATYSAALQNAANPSIDHQSEYGERYDLPTESQARIIFPGHRLERGQLTDHAPNDPAIVEFTKSAPNKTYQEDVEIWNSMRLTYSAEYRSSPSNTIYYGLRLRGPNVPQGMDPRQVLARPDFPDPNSWLSAYRYEKRADGVLVRVRHLGATKHQTTVDQIAQESYWDADPGYGTPEYRLFVPKGRYWTKTVVNRQGGRAVSVMRVLSKNERTIAKSENAAYVSDTEHLSHAESPRFAKDKENPYLLITRKQDPLKSKGSGPSIPKPNKPTRPPKRPGFPNFPRFPR